MVDNCWLERRVICYAHQGGAREAPSSTLYAIERAIATGATGIELDVHATADRKLVVCHDPTVDRTTPSSGEIRTMSLAELRELDNAYWFVEGEDVLTGLPDDRYPLRGRAPEDHRLGIASLEEVLEAVEGVVLNLDIKRTAPDVEPYEELLADVLHEHGRTNDVIVASFDDAATSAFARVAPDIATSAGTTATAEFFYAAQAGDPPPETATRHAALQVPVCYQGVTVVEDRFVEAAHSAGLAVHVWTIDDDEEMNRLLDLGVDGIITDRPSVLAPLLERRSMAWRP